MLVTQVIISGVPLPIYRVYILDESDRIRDFQDLEAMSDAEGIERGKQLGRTQRSPIEIWRRKVMLYRDK